MQLTSNGPSVNPVGFQQQQQQQPPKLGTSNSVPGVLNVPSSVAAVNASSSSGGSPNEWNPNSVFNANRVLHSIILLLSLIYYPKLLGLFMLFLSLYVYIYIKCILFTVLYFI